MPYYCTVPRCTSMAGKAKNVSFHQFPRDEELASLWNKILKRGKPYTKYSKVCSLHFRPEDYTITSVGKNKGQWRTLRKDAIPSQNLPLESPGPSRASAGYWVPNLPTTMPDPQVLSVQQQVAQAIYLQTMLATQAAANGTPQLSAQSDNIETPTDLSSNHPTNSIPDLSDHIKEHTQNSLNDARETPDYDKAQNSSYQCQECSKCFKDPDVFMLHRRTHKKCDERLTNNPLGKENFNVNADLSTGDTLKANPILANLLKSGMPPDLSSNLNKVFDVNNILSIENQIMAALAVSMESYIQNLTTLQAAARKKGDSEAMDSHDSDNSQIITNERENDLSDHDRVIDGNNKHYDDGQKLQDLVTEQCQSNEIDNMNGEDANWSDENCNSYQEYEKYVLDSANALNQTESDDNNLQNDLNQVAHDQSHVAHDQSHVAHDQNHVADEQNHVAHDQSYIAHDQSHASNEQNHVANDQSHVANDHIDFFPHDQTLDSVIEPNCDNQDLNESKDSNLVIGQAV